MGVVRRGLKLTSENEQDLSGDTTSADLDSSSKFDINKQDAKESKSHTGHQAYIDIPVATASTYGVITNQTQTIGGAKNFNSNLSVAGQLNLTGNFETTVNGINAQSIKVGDVTITASNGVITFS